MNRLIILAVLALLPLGAGCSIKKMAVNKLGDALAKSGSSLASDDDPDLIADAAPFSLKLMESLLDESPRHRGLLLAATSGFTQYSYAFVQQRSAELEEKDLEAASAMRARAGRLYFRAQRYGLRGLEVNLPGFEKTLRADPTSAARTSNRKMFRSSTGPRPRGRRRLLFRRISLRLWPICRLWKR